MTTELRYEVWASDTGETSHWLLMQVFETGHTAITFAQKLVRFKRVEVECWRVGTNTFQSTYWKNHDI